MTHHYAYADLVWCQGKLMFAEDITGKEGKIGLLEENAGLIENPLFDDVSAGIYYVGYSEVSRFRTGSANRMYCVRSSAWK